MVAQHGLQRIILFIPLIFLILFLLTSKEQVRSSEAGTTERSEPQDATRSKLNYFETMRVSTDGTDPVVESAVKAANPTPKKPMYKELVYDRENTRHINKYLQFKWIDSRKKYGLVSKFVIPKYSIISAEYPMFTVPPDYVNKKYQEMIALDHINTIRVDAVKRGLSHKLDSVFYTEDEWLEIAKKFKKYLDGAKQGYDTKNGFNIYSVFSKVNGGFPQNALPIFGDKGKCILMATKDIKADEEIVTGLMHYYGKRNNMLQQLDSKVIPESRKKELLFDLYPDGFILKEAGKELEVVRRESVIDTSKEAVVKFINSGNIFKYVMEKDEKALPEIDIDFLAMKYPS